MDEFRNFQFDKEFPVIDTIRVEYYESGLGADGTTLKEQTHILTNKQHVPDYVRCSCKFCAKGGFWLAPEIRRMASDREETKEGGIMCEGDEGPQKGKIQYSKRCLNILHYKIAATYRATLRTTRRMIPVSVGEI